MKSRLLALAFVLASGAAHAATINVTVPGTSNLWLSGALAGTTLSGDVAPRHSPVLVTGLDLVAGQVLTFSASGLVSNGGTVIGSNPDGGNSITHNGGAANGISDLLAPYNSLIGVFLSDAVPVTGTQPVALSFGSVASRDFTELQPLLQQAFFIGDGQTSTGLLQQIIAPEGATRLFLGTMDKFAWYDNRGTFTVAVSFDQSNIPSVPLPAALPLMLAGLGGLAFVSRRRR